MSIEEIKSGTLYKEYKMNIPYEEVNHIIELKIKELLPTVTLPGFRKGKAPINIVRKKYENNVLSEAIENLVQTKTKELIESKDLKIFSQPQIDLKKYEKNEPIEVEVKVNLDPEIKLKDLKNKEINTYEIDLDKSFIKKNYEDFIKSQKKYSKVKTNRIIKKNDKVIINLLTHDESAPDYLKTQKNLPIVIDSEYQVLPEIGPKLLEKKLKKTDKETLNLDISKSLKLDKEKLISFEIEIVEIEESIPFVIDKDFLDKNGLKDENDLKNNIEDGLKSQFQAGLKQIQKKELMDILDKEHKFDLPQGILEQESNDIWHRVEHAKKEGTLDDDDKKLSNDELKKRYENIAKRRVKLSILLQFISKENNITVDEKELSNGMMQYASRYPGQEKEIIEYFKKNPSTIETIRGPILEEKVMEYLISNAKINKVKVSRADYEKKQKEVFKFD